MAAATAKARVSQLRALTKRISPDTWALLAIAAAVLLANLPYLTGLFVANPLGPRSALVSALAPGRLVGGSTIDPNAGFISQALSHRAALDLIHLHLPWWDPFEATGAPLAGEIQSAALFPPTLLTLLSNGQLYEHILLELVGGSATYLLLRRLAIGRPASVAGAIAFALNGTFAWLANAPFNPVAFLPLLLLGIELAYSASARDRRGGWWLIALAGALSFYAGFPEVAYIDALLAICWIVWRGGCLPRDRLRGFAVKIALGVIAGVALSAPLLIAAIDYLGHADVGAHSGSLFAGVSLPPQALPQLVLPYVYGPIFGFIDPHFTLERIWGGIGGYLTSSLLLFACYGLLRRGRVGLRVILCGWIVLVAARIYGLPGLGAVLGVLPGMSHVAFVRYADPALALPVIILAALGLGALMAAGADWRRIAGAALLSLVIVVAAALGALPLADQLGPTFTQHAYFAATVVWGVLAVVCGAAFAVLPSQRLRAALVTLVVVCDVIVMFAIPELSAPRAVRTDLGPVAFLKQHLGNARFFTLGPLQPNYGAYFGIDSLNINDIPIPSSFASYVRARLDHYVDPTVFVGTPAGGRSRSVPSSEQELLRNLPGYRAAGVSYVLTVAAQSLPQSPATFQLVYRSPTTQIYHLTGAAPLFTASGCSVTAQDDATVQVACASSSTLIRRETYMPGWVAQIDGRAATVTPAHGLFQRIAVPAGRHHVSFSFSPPNIDWGYAGFAAGCVLLLLPLVLSRTSRRGT